MVNYKSKVQLILRMKLTCNFRKLRKYSYITFENFIFMSHPQNYKTKISDILLQLNIECERIVTYQEILYLNLHLSKTMQRFTYDFISRYLVAYK